MPINRKLQNIIGTEHITDAAETAIAAQASGGATVAFKNVAVSGQDNVVADAATDTLTLVGGTNVTLTTDASADSVTITAAGGGTAYQAFNTIKPVRGYADAYKFINLMQAPYGVYNNKIASGSHSQTVPVYVPFVLPSDMTCTHLVINLGATTGNANVNFECAVYSADTNGYPSTQLFKSTFAVGSGSSTGDLQVAITNTGGTGALNGGEIYWVGANYADSPSGNITTQRMSDNSDNNGGLLGTNSPFVNMNAIAIRENGITSYQGMPSTVTVTTGTSWQTLKLDLIAIAAVFSA